jgi:hypothetical protein
MKRRDLIKYGAASLIMARLTPFPLPVKRKMVIATPTSRWDVTSSSPLLDLMNAAEKIRNQPFDPHYAEERLKTLSSVWS